MMLEHVIKRGNIVNREYKEETESGRYIANGRFGAVIGRLGLNMSPALQKKYPKTGVSQYTHLNHWGRFQFLSEAMEKQTVADYILPLFKMYWEKEPVSISDYNQVQDFYDGTVETAYTLENGTRIRVINWFDMVEKNLSGTRIFVSEGIIPVKVSAITDFIPYAFLYKTRTKQTVEITKVGDNYCLTIDCKKTINHRSSKVYFYSNSPIEICDDGIRILACQGVTEIYVSYGEPVKQSKINDSFERTKKKWHEKWESGGWFDFPEDTAQKTWVRSNAYLIASYDDDFGPIQPTNGLTGNMFPFHFVQDLEYISPALMMLGNVHIVKRWIEKFASEIESMKKYARLLWHEAKGIYPPWELPYGTIEGYHTPSVPVVYCYEPHNAGYLCRLAREASDFIEEKDWEKTYVYPLIREVGEFYKAFAFKGQDGHWHLEWNPCIGQDEAGGRNKKDYLCSMYSAKYTFKTVVECGLDEDGSIANILADGLAFESLCSNRGIYHTCQGADDFGKQKHPVQLDGLAYFPIEKKPLNTELAAYAVRYDITEGARNPFFHGWTLSEFLLTSTNVKDIEGWKKDWAQMRTSNYTDSEWVQIYETSGQAEKSFYMTNHGMILQSLIRNYVNDYWGKLEIASCPVFTGDVIFKNIKTRIGVTVSGEVKNGVSKIEIVADRDCVIKVNQNDHEIWMKKGQKIFLQL